MRLAFSSIRIFSLVLVLVVAGAACGDDDAGSDDGDDEGGGQIDAGDGGDDDGGEPDAGDDDGGEPDAGTEPDAGPSGPARLWVHGDFATDGRLQLGAYVIGEETPAVAAPLLPTGDTATLRPIQSDAGNYDFSRSGDLVALPTDLEVTGRFDLYAGPADGSALNQVVAMTENADVDKARVSPDGTLIAFTADLEADQILSAYVVPADAIGATPTLVSPATAIGNVDDLVWSRNSNSLLVTGIFTQAGFFEMILVDLGGKDPTPVPLIERADILCTAGSCGVIQPLVRLGANVVFKGRMDEDNRNKLYIIDAAGVGPVQVLPESQILREDGTTTAGLGRVDVSPDGNQLAFAADRTPGVFDLWVMPSSGSAAPQQMTSGLTAGAPTTGNPLKWRPDNQAIAVIATWGVPGKLEPFVVPLDGSGQRRVISVGDDTVATQAVDWSDDGSQVFVVADYLTNEEYELFSVDAAATDETAPTLVFDTVAGGSLRHDLTLTR